MKKVLVGMIVGLVSLAIYGCSKNNEIYEEMMEQGLKQIEKEEFASAESFFTKALEEKPDDEKATVLLEQTQNIQEAQEAFAEGDFETAKSSAEQAIKPKEGADKIVENAKGLISEMDKMEEDKEGYAASFEEAKQQLDQGKFNETIQALQAIMKNDLSHAYFKEIKEQSESLLEKAKDAEEEAKAQAKAQAEAEARAEAEAKAKAEAEAKAKEEAKAAEQAHKEKREAEEKAKKEAASKDVGAAAGYWVTEDRTEACHLTSTYLACAVKQSDVMFNDKIESIRHVSSNEMELTFSGGYKSTLVLVGNDVLQGEAGKMIRVSKEEANGIYEGYYELP